MYYCSSCGEAVRAGERFCSRCFVGFTGSSQGSPDDRLRREQAYARQKRRHSWWKVREWLTTSVIATVGAILAAAVLIPVGWFLFNRARDTFGLQDGAEKAAQSLVTALLFAPIWIPLVLAGYLLLRHLIAVLREPPRLSRYDR